VKFQNVEISKYVLEFKFSKMLYHIYMGYTIHDVLNKVIVYNA
jgi:hypothetical protein